MVVGVVVVVDFVDVVTGSTTTTQHSIVSLTKQWSVGT